MRKLDTSGASTSVSQPFKAGTAVHLQLAYQEALNALAQNIVGPGWVNNIVYVLFGCVNGGIGTNFNMTAGAVYYQGEVFLVDAASFTTSGPNVAIANIDLTYFTDVSADPTTFSDGSLHNVHQVRKIKITRGLTGTSPVGDFSDFKQTQLVLVNRIFPTLGATYTVKFDQDYSDFFISATVDTEIFFDLTNAIPGAVCRMQWTWGSGRSLTVTAGSGNLAYLEGGDTSRAASHTNSMYFIYAGIDNAGNNIIGYSISQIA